MLLKTHGHHLDSLERKYVFVFELVIIMMYQDNRTSNFLISNDKVDSCYNQYNSTPLSQYLAIINDNYIGTFHRPLQP